MLMQTDDCRGFNHDDRWGHRAGEPNKAVICSIALARLRTEQKPSSPGGPNGDLSNGNATAVGMAQKLLLFWRKPARRCWWEGVELDNVEGVEGRLKVWIRRVWTLEMVSIASDRRLLSVAVKLRGLTVLSRASSGCDSDGLGYRVYRVH